MITRIISYGLIGALIVGGLMYTGMLSQMSGGEHEMSENGLFVGYLTQLIALIFVFLGVKAHRDNALGGVIKFFPAFGIGLAISAIACLGWVISWEIVVAVTNFDMGPMMKAQALAEAQAKGLGQADIDKAIAGAESFAQMYKNPLVRMPITFLEMAPAGILVSLVSAALLRNSRFLPPVRAAAI